MQTVTNIPILWFLLSGLVSKLAVWLSLVLSSCKQITNNIIIAIRAKDDRESIVATDADSIVLRPRAHSPQVVFVVF